MKRVAGALVAVALLAGACGSKDKDDKTDAAKSADTTSTTAAGQTPTSTGAAGSGTTVPGSGKATGSGQNATATTAKSSGGATATTTAKSSTAPKPAQPGTYTYNRTGTSHTSVFGDQSMDGQVSLKVDPATGSDQHTTMTSPEGTSEQTLRALAEGAYLVMSKQSSNGITKEFRPDPIVLVLPSNPTVGRSWSWSTTSTDGKTKLDAALKIERNETIAVGGEQVPTVVVSIVLKASGDITFTSTSYNWVSLAKSLIMRTDTTTDGTFNNVQFHQQYSQILQSTRPS